MNVVNINLDVHDVVMSLLVGLTTKNKRRMEITDYNFDYDFDDAPDEIDDINDNDFDINLDHLGYQDSVSFLGGSEKSLEYDLRQAQKNVDYYQREIRNFSEFTTETYKRNCISHLERALERVEEISEKLEKLRSK